MTRPTLHRAWLPTINQHEADTRAALIDRPPATTFADVLAIATRREPSPARDGRFNHLPRYALLIIGCGAAALIGSMFQ